MMTSNHWPGLTVTSTMIILRITGNGGFQVTVCKNCRVIYGGFEIFYPQAMPTDIFNCSDRQDIFARIVELAEESNRRSYT